MMQMTTSPADAYSQNHAEALRLLDEIEALLYDLPAPDFEGFTPEWRHVADMEMVVRRLREAREAMPRA